MKKIAIPTRENMVDDHFGHCAYYTIVTINGEQLKPAGIGWNLNVNLQNNHKKIPVLFNVRGFFCIFALSYETEQYLPCIKTALRNP